MAAEGTGSGWGKKKKCRVGSTNGLVSMTTGPICVRTLLLHLHSLSPQPWGCKGCLYELDHGTVNVVYCTAHSGERENCMTLTTSSGWTWVCCLSSCWSQWLIRSQTSHPLTCWETTWLFNRWLNHLKYPSRNIAMRQQHFKLPQWRSVLQKSS